MSEKFKPPMPEAPKPEEKDEDYENFLKQDYPEIKPAETKPVVEKKNDDLDPAYERFLAQGEKEASPSVVPKTRREEILVSPRPLTNRKRGFKIPARGMLDRGRSYENREPENREKNIFVSLKDKIKGLLENKFPDEHKKYRVVIEGNDDEGYIIKVINKDLKKSVPILMINGEDEEEAFKNFKVELFKFIKNRIK